MRLWMEGLDAMLRNLGRISGRILNLPPMSGRRYAMLSPEERRAWATAAYRGLHGNRSHKSRSGPVVARPEPPAKDRSHRTTKDRPNSVVKPAVGLRGSGCFVEVFASICKTSLRDVGIANTTRCFVAFFRCG